MNSSELKNIIEDARIEKGISQRELAKLSGISRSTLNDLINGKIKKIGVDELKRIAEVLDLSLIKLLKAAEYEEFLDFLSLDKDKNKSSKDLKEELKKSKESERKILEFDKEKRDIARKVRRVLFLIEEHLKIAKENEDSLYTIDNAIEDVHSAYEMIEPIENKYDYHELPKK